MFWRTGLKTTALTAAVLLVAAGTASAKHHGDHHGGSHAVIHGGHGGYRPGLPSVTVHHSGYYHHGYYPGFYGWRGGYGYRPYYPSFIVGGYTPYDYSDFGPVDNPSLTVAPAPWHPAGYPRPVPASPEELVRSWYQKFLHRDPDPQWSVWVEAVRNGQEPNAVLAAILGSQEYYNNAGGTPEGFVQALFQDLSGRRPTPEEMGYWVRRVLDRDRNDMAYALLTR
jgi:hypothetical protein